PRSPSSTTPPPPRRDDGTGLVNHDPWLEPYSERLRERFNHYKNILAKIEQTSPGGLLGPISQGHHYFGLNRGTQDNTPAGRPGTFEEFIKVVLPRVAYLGYNAIQMMAVMEHPYYGSFGYHVSNFFAVSSRFGTPEELKHLIDTAHGMGLRIVMDIVHSHSVK